MFRKLPFQMIADTRWLVALARSAGYGGNRQSTTCDCTGTGAGCGRLPSQPSLSHCRWIGWSVRAGVRCTECGCGAPQSQTGLASYERHGTRDSYGWRSPTLAACRPAGFWPRLADYPALGELRLGYPPEEVSFLRWRAAQPHSRRPGSAHDRTGAACRPRGTPGDGAGCDGGHGDHVPGRGRRIFRQRPRR